MSLELWALFVAMVLGLVHLTVASFTFKAQVGNAYSVGPRVRIGDPRALQDD